MNAFYYRNRIAINKCLFIIGFFVFIYLFVNYIFAYIAPFFIAFVLSLIFNPLAEFITKKLKAPRWFGSLICMIIIIFFILFVGTNLITRILKEAHALYINFPYIVEKSSSTIANWREQYKNVFEFIPGNFRDTFDSLISSLATSFTSSIGNVFKNNSIDVVVKIPSILMVVILTLVSTFFFINDRVLINQSLTQNAPYWLSKNIKLVRKGILDAIGGYLRAQLIIMSVVATICIISLSVLKNPYALFIGLVIAVVDALPILGSGFVLWPWIAYSFINGEASLAIGLLITYGIVLITRQSLEPRVLGQQIGVHPLITLMALYIGLKIFGGIGFLVGPLVVIIVKTILNANTPIETPRRS